MWKKTRLLLRSHIYAVCFSGLLDHSSPGMWNLSLGSLGSVDNANVYSFFFFFNKPFYQCYLITGCAEGPADGSVAFFTCMCDGFTSFCGRFATSEEEHWCFLFFFLHLSVLVKEIFSPIIVEQT